MSEHLPLLNQLTIPSPCPASWAEMTGDDQQRHCEQCDKTVFHLSNVTAAEAERIVQEHDGDLCARIRVRRTDGRILTAEDPGKSDRFRRWIRRTLALATALPLAFFSGCADDVEADPVVDGDDEISTMLAGEVCIDPNDTAADPVQGRVVMGKIRAPGQEEPEDQPKDQPEGEN